MNTENENTQNSAEATTVSEKQPSRIKALIFAVAASLLYSAYLIHFSLNAMDIIIRTILWYSLYPFFGFASILLMLCLPISMVVSVWRMWSQYSSQNYRKIYWSGFLPLFAIFFIMAAGQVLQLLFNILYNPVLG